MSGTLRIACVGQVPIGDSAARETPRVKMRRLVDEGRFPEARVRVLQIVFGPDIDGIRASPRRSAK